MSADPDLYEALGCDPSVTDEARLLAELEACRRRWSEAKTQGSRQAQTEAKKWWPHLDALRAVIGDPAKVAAQSRQAIGRRHAAEKQRQEAVATALRVFALANPTYTPDQVRRLQAHLGGKVDVAEIERRLRELGVGPAGAGPAPAPRPSLEASVYRRIRSQLEVAGKKDLYDAMGLKPSDSNAAMCAAAEALAHEIRQGRSDDQRQALLSLTGDVRTLFSSAEQRAAYERARAREALDGPTFSAALKVAGTDAFVSAAQLELLVRTGGKLGVAKELVVDFVLETAAARSPSWRVQQLGARELEALPQCGVCGAIAGRGQARCATCGTLLSQPCPRCKATVSSSSQACASCGLHLGDHALAERFLERADRALERRAWDDALADAERALGVMPTEPRATKARAAALAGQRARAAALAAARQDLDEARCVAARRRLVELGEPGPDVDALLADVATALAKADELVQRGRARLQAGSPDEAAGLYQQALVVASDHAGARAALETCPPAAPQGVTVAAGPAVQRVTWRSGTPGVTFRVLRQRGRAPTSATDGDVVVETPGTLADDTVAPVGVPCWYAVVALRGGVPSTPTVAARAVLRLADVSDLRAMPADGRVELTWRCPDAAMQVEVWRAPGAVAPERGAGTQVPASRTGAVDTVPNDARHAWRVCVAFADPEAPGRPRWATGATVTCAAVAPPAPVRDLRALVHGREARASWTPVGRGQVQLRVATTDPTPWADRVVPVADLDRLGSLAASAGPGSALVPIPPRGRVWLVPVTTAGDAAAIGVAYAVSSIPAVSDLRVKASGRDALVTWSWPDGVECAGVATSTTGPVVQPRAADATWEEVPRATYDRDGGSWLRGVGKAALHVSVFARATDEDLWSPPTSVHETLGNPVWVSYRVVLARRYGLFGAPTGATLRLEASEPVVLHDVLVVARKHDIPVHVDQGRQIDRIASLRVGPGAVEHPLPSTEVGSGQYVGLFFSDPARNKLVRLTPAGRDIRSLG